MSVSGRILPLAPLMAVTLLLGACASGDQRQNSGFLTSYDQFRPGPEDGVDRIWTEPGIRTKQDFARLIAPYDAVLVEPVKVFYKNREAYDGIEPGELSKLTKKLEQTIRQSLSGKYRIASQPGPKTMRVSMALTNVETPNKLLATTSSILPVGLGISMLSKVTTGEHTNVGSATIEAVFSDSATGRALFAVMDRKAGNKDLGTIHNPTDDAEDAFRWWGQRLQKTVAGQ